MAALAEIGGALERFGQRLQSRETPREPVTPFEHAKKLWETIAPGRKIDPVESVIFRFGFQLEGIRPESREQAIFISLLKPYRGLFPELDNFTTTLSISHEADDISFKVAVFAPPPSPQFSHERPYPVFAARELPRQKRGEYSTPYNMLILGESKLYSGKLDRELTGIEEGRRLSWQGFEEWEEEPRGDVEWRRQFTTDVLKLFTRIVEPHQENVSEYNQGIQDRFRKKEKAVSWWSRTWGDRLHPGAVWPESLHLYETRATLVFSPPHRLVAKLQRA